MNRGARAFWNQWFRGPNMVKRGCLYLSFVFVLVCFLHFRAVKVEVLEIGTVAPRYVIAQVDFSFSDSEATQILKQEAVKDIGVIRRVSPEEIRRFRLGVEHELVSHQEWRSSLESPFQELYDLLEDAEKQLLLDRFTDARTWQKIEQLSLPKEDFYPLFILAQGEKTVLLPAPFWQEFTTVLKRQALFHEETVEYVVGLFSKHPWVLVEDVSTERYVRQLVQDQVPNKYTRVEAGSEIVTQGEMITTRHIAMVQGMQQALASALNVWSWQTIVGSIVLASILSVVAYVCLLVFSRRVLVSTAQLALLLTIIVLTLLFAKGTEYLLLHQGSNLIEIARFPIIVPFASLLICLLIGSELAIWVSCFLIIVLSVSLAVDPTFFLLSNSVAALMTIIFAQGLHRRKEILVVCIQVWLVCIPVFVGCNLMDGTFCSLNPLTDMMSSALFMSLIAVLVAIILPALESLFGVLTDMMLVEYMDPNHPLLKRLSLEAPGTYQHSLVVGNLAEMAARAIGGNGLLCRVAALYHDIGKLFNPHYFTENQLSGFNIHQLLTPLESTQVIIAHVTEGEALARKHNLPDSFIDMIKEHHGTTLVYYFYCKQLEHLQGDPLQIHEHLFRYPGPKPRSKEAGIIMLADVLEAASRSLDEVSEGSVTEMVERLVAEKIQDRQLDECQLSFEELNIIKTTMIRSFLVTRHLRVKYARAPNVLE